MTYAANVEVSFEMLDPGLRSLAAGSITFLRTALELNAADFDGDPSFYFEVVGRNNDTSARTVTLRDVTNSTDRATVSIPASTTSLTRLRSSAFTPASGAVTYQVIVPQTTSDYQVDVWAARIVVVQTAATKTVVQIPLVSGQHNWLSQRDDDSYLGYVTGTTYGQQDPATFSRWLKTASAWATVSGCVLQAVHRSNDASYTSTVSLVDIDDSDAVIASATTTSTDVVVTSTSFNWADLTDAHCFEIKHKSSSAGTHSFLYRAALLVQLSSLEKGEVYRRTASYQSETASQVWMYGQRQLYTASHYSSPTTYHECTGYCNESADRVLLRDHADNVGDDASDVTGTAINWNSATKVRKRTASFSPHDGYDFHAHLKSGTAVQSITNSFLVVAFAGTVSGNPYYAYAQQ